MWNEEQEILVDTADVSSPLVSDCIFDVYAINSNTVLILWCNTRNKYLTVSHLRLNFANRTFTNLETLLYKCNVMPEEPEDMIFSTDIAHRFVIRSPPPEERLNFYDSAAMNIDQIAKVDLKTRNFHVFNFHIFNQTLYMLETRDVSFSSPTVHGPQPFPKPHLISADLEVMKTAGKRDDIVLRTSAFERSEATRPDADNDLDRVIPVSTAFYKTTGYLLCLLTDLSGQPVRFPRRNERIPLVYKLFSVDLLTNQWREVVIQPEFFGPMREENRAYVRPQVRVPRLRVVGGVTLNRFEAMLPAFLRSRFRFMRTSLEFMNMDRDGHLSLSIFQGQFHSHRLTNIGNLRVEFYRTPLRKPELLTNLAWFIIKQSGLSQNVKVPRNFSGRSLFSTITNVRDFQGQNVLENRSPPSTSHAYNEQEMLSEAINRTEQMEDATEVTSDVYEWLTDQMDNSLVGQTSERREEQLVPLEEHQLNALEMTDQLVEMSTANHQIVKHKANP
ncbi:hypothetical protein M3Y98_00695800 [Aphelenchoides besseyi]|nr:hypothetical protein M3Y98_00695800 [Aphelenchoides besseyi]